VVSKSDRLLAPPKKCSKTFVEFFDDGWPEYEKTFTLMQA
jgi:hypothetical protein